MYLTGAISIEHDGRLIEARQFPGRQGRLAFAFLVSERHRAVGRDEVAAVLWGDEPPDEIDSAVDALLSKLRGVLKKAGCDGTIDARGGAVRVRLAADVWVDLEAAAASIDQAEGALRAQKLTAAWSAAVVAITIARRAFFGDENAPWIEARRKTLRSTLVRGLQCLSEISAANGEMPLAVQYATEIVDLEPFRETGYQHLMRLHAQVGNRAEALRVFARCRELMRDELGASPSPATEAVFLEILRAQAD